MSAIYFILLGMAFFALAGVFARALKKQSVRFTKQINQVSADLFISEQYRRSAERRLEKSSQNYLNRIKLLQDRLEEVRLRIDHS